jgi:hypothetical protein
MHCQTQVFSNKLLSTYIQLHYKHVLNEFMIVHKSMLFLIAYNTNSIATSIRNQISLNLLIPYVISQILDSVLCHYRIAILYDQWSNFSQFSVCALICAKSQEVYKLRERRMWVTYGRNTCWCQTGSFQV